MCQIPEPAKRIVTKSRYAASVGKKMALASVGLSLLGIGAVGLIMAGLLILIRCIDLEAPVTMSSALLITACISGGAITVFLLGTYMFNKAKKIEVGIPLTPEVTDALPTSKSLLRASAEPVQAQQTVLLRACIQGKEATEEQLLRPAEGREQA